MRELPIFLYSTLLNEKGQVTPTGYQTLMTSVAERYFALIGQDDASIMRHGHSLVYLAATTQVFRPFSYSDSITCRVWLSTSNGIASRLEIQGYNVTRQEASFGGALWFALIDLTTRKLFRESEKLLDFSRFDRGEPQFDSVSRIDIDSARFAIDREVVVLPSWIDTVGHCGNVRYFDMVYDTLTSRERLSMDRLARAEVYYRRELTEGETIRIGRLDEDGAICVAGLKADGQAGFVCRLFFKP